MSEALMILGMACVTFMPRYGVLALLGRVEMPRSLFRALRFVPPAVLSAIILPAIVFDGRGRVFISTANSYLAAGLITALIAWRSRNLLLTIVLGMVALWLWRAVFGT